MDGGKSGRGRRVEGEFVFWMNDDSNKKRWPEGVGDGAIIGWKGGGGGGFVWYV